MTNENSSRPKGFNSREVDVTFTISATALIHKFTLQSAYCVRLNSSFFLMEKNKCDCHSA